MVHRAIAARAAVVELQHPCGHARELTWSRTQSLWTLQERWDGLCDWLGLEQPSFFKSALASVSVRVHCSNCKFRGLSSPGVGIGIGIGSGAGAEKSSGLFSGSSGDLILFGSLLPDREAALITIVATLAEVNLVHRTRQAFAEFDDHRFGVGDRNYDQDEELADDDDVDDRLDDKCDERADVDTVLLTRFPPHGPTS